MTITEQAALIGKERLLRISTPDGKETIHVPVVVKDTRNAFGRVMLVIEPVNGEGQMTVNLDRTKERGQSV